MHIWYRAIADRTPSVAAHGHSNLLANITRKLELGKAGTTFYVGHDGDLDALASLLGLSWRTHPFPENATTPGSALRFDLDANRTMVSVSVVYNEFVSADATPHSVRASIGAAGGASSMPLTDFTQLVGRVLDPACVEPHNTLPLQRRE